MEDLHKLWGHRWLSPKAKVGKSKIHGIGVFVAEDIKSGETILVCGGVIVPSKDIKEYRKCIGHNVGAPIDNDFYICPADEKELLISGAINHSCSPNLGVSDTVKLVAMRNIKSDEELVLDYAFYEANVETFACNCKSPNCRKIIKPDDWKIPELQKKYGEYFSRYLREKFQK